MPASREDAPQVRSEINVTPLADVMLVLLIIFMVITPLLGTSVDVDVPEAAASTEHPDNEETLTLAVKGDGTVFLNQDPIARRELPTILEARLHGRADRVLYVKADRNLSYGEVQAFMEECRAAGASEVALITRAKEEP